MVETLVSLVIIATLTALITSAVQSARDYANAAKCAANLKIVGVALHEYIAEHDQYLPGPSMYGQAPLYSTIYPAYWGTLLYAYLGLPTPTKQVATTPQLLCPSWQKATKNSMGIAFYCPNSVSTSGGGSIAPFGIVGGAGPQRITLFPNLGSIIALQEIDKKSPYQLPGNDWWGNLPSQGVHSGRRNTLYLDGHVVAE